ncbi:MAG: M13 family metallopeptidase [Bacteroidetes bacterium]|nr:M13 family metallopeptidase [Bacteroidota bacterium]
MKKMFFKMAFLAILVIVTSCNSGKNNKKSPDPLISHIDSTVKAGNDFFLFANGKWFKENPIPPSEQANGLWQLIQDTINAQVRTICKSSAAVKDAGKGSNKQKIGDFFFSGMDSASINKKGLADLKEDLDRITAIKDIRGLVSEAAYIHAVSGSPMFRFYVGQDDRISSKQALFIFQGGLSLPDRNYYFDNDPRAVMIRGKFNGHLTNMFKLMGYQDDAAKLAADRTMKLETALAKASRKREDTRDPLKNYNKIPLARLKASMPDFDWELFMQSSGLKTVDTVVVGQPEFLTAENGLLKSVPLDDWKNYLKFHLIGSLSRFLDDKTFLESFSFYSTVLRGVKEPKPRWERVVEQTDRSLGELIGQVYVDEYLPKGTKEKLQEIGKRIMEVYAERIRNLDWMSDATKKKALTKLGTVIMKVGYPDKWKDLSSMVIDRSSYVKNGMNANKWEFAYNMSKFGKPVDRTEWDMEPQTYNAYYNPSNNEIVVPGCNIIIPGYERTMADDALLYSIIGGSTFGHEITHGFDDQGCKYDEFGNLHNWWTKEDSTKFFSRTKLIVRQFNEFIAVDSLHVNGELTQGENIADLGGVIMGYEAFKKTSQYINKEMIAGLSPDQRYFLGYGLAWMVNTRPEAIANQVKSNEHSPPRFRVLGPLANIPEFYATFEVKQGDAMWRPDSLRVKIW